MLVMVLLLQCLSGLLSSSYYNPFYSIPFDPVSYTMIDTNLGWLVRYYHMVGSSLFLLVPFQHWIRAVWLRLRVINSLSFIWIPGRIIFILSLIEGFSGHVSNRGQMSYRGITVMINILAGLFAEVNIDPLFTGWFWCSYHDIINRISVVHFPPASPIGLVMVVHLHIPHRSSSMNPISNSCTSPIMPSHSLLHKDRFIIPFLSTLSSARSTIVVQGI